MKNSNSARLRGALGRPREIHARAKSLKSMIEENDKGLMEGLTLQIQSTWIWLSWAKSLLDYRSRGLNIIQF